ncbi:MAG: hypothetical protein PQJ60_10885 [Spirochaetales bacterium]|nr:hypothetical protein [Spirochaetales bacterium]
MTKSDKDEIARIARESGLEEASLYVVKLFKLEFPHAEFVAKTAKEAPLTIGPLAVC